MNQESAIYLADGYVVRDDFRQRGGGRVTGLRPATQQRPSDPVWIDVAWPDGTRSTYTADAAREFLVVEQVNPFDLFRLGVEL